MVLSVVVLSVYYAGLLMFSFVSHPVSYCFFLLLCSASVMVYLYLVLGFCWYVLLLCLVYVGGVYVLFVFVSVFIPNTHMQTGESFYSFLFLFLLFFFVLYGGSWGLFIGSVSEGSYYLCSFYEGLSYCFFCLVLLVGFSVLSLVVSEKASFFR